LLFAFCFLLFAFCFLLFAFCTNHSILSNAKLLLAIGVHGEKSAFLLLSKRETNAQNQTAKRNIPHDDEKEEVQRFDPKQRLRGEAHNLQET
jgi:hypothetical protein